MLKLYMHPLSSYCHKALIGFYEHQIAFTPVVIDQTTLADFKRLWPLAKFPVLQDEARGELVPESSIIIEYLELHYPGAARLIPSDPDAALKVRMRDRFFDLYLHTPVQKWPADRLRPAEHRDPYGVDEARRAYRAALDTLETDLSGKHWAMGTQFTLADCAAAPALYFGERFFGSFRDSHPRTTAYLDRLMARPSYARALAEAQPYLHLVPH